MYILGFESSCDETSASVVERNGDSFIIRSNVIASQVDTHKLYGGVVPEIASRAHIEAISSITYEALELAGIEIKDVSLIAVTSHPGLIGALLVGVNFAKSLASSYGIPLVDVDHIKGHIAAAYLTEDPPCPPFVSLVISGGHTGIYRVDDYNSYTVIGSTRDDAIGESFDKIGRLIGIPYPAGKGFDALSAEGFVSVTGKEEISYEDFARHKIKEKYSWHLPSPALSGENLDFSFSGLKTAAINLLHRYDQTKEELPRAHFAAAYTYEAIEALAKKVAQTLAENEGAPLVVAGGVAANSHIRARLSSLCKKMGRKMHVPPLSLCGDNAAMIAAEGYYRYRSGALADSTLNGSAAD